MAAEEVYLYDLNTDKSSAWATLNVRLDKTPPVLACFLAQAQEAKERATGASTEEEAPAHRCEGIIARGRYRRGVVIDVYQKGKGKKKKGPYYGRIKWKKPYTDEDGKEQYETEMTLATNAKMKKAGVGRQRHLRLVRPQQVRQAARPQQVNGRFIRSCFAFSSHFPALSSHTLVQFIIYKASLHKAKNPSLLATMDQQQKHILAALAKVQEQVNLITKTVVDSLPPPAIALTPSPPSDEPIDWIAKGTEAVNAAKITEVYKKSVIKT